MDANKRDLCFVFAALSLFCAGFAWSEDRVVFSAVFVTLGAVALIGMAESHWRS
jgi:hypothetical protein